MRFALFLIGILFPLSTSAQIAITEVRWAGSEVSTADEWLRIENISNSAVDLSGWSITTRKSDGSDKTMVMFTSQILESGASFLISNYPQSKSALSEVPDLVTTAVSLPNSKLLLRVLDADGAVIDTVDDGIGTPFAGGRDPFRSMLRIDPLLPGDDVGNWRTEGEEEEESGKRKEENESSSSSSSSLSSQPSQPSQSSQSSQSSKKNPNPKDFSVTRIIPRPKSGSRNDQTVTIRYTGGSTVTLDGWTLDNREGGSSPVRLDGIEFRPNQTRQFQADWLGIVFTPEEDSVRLIDDDGDVISALHWAKTEIDVAIRPEQKPEKFLPVRVVDSRDPDNIRIALTEESLRGMLPRVERYWSRIHHKYREPSIRVSFDGVSEDDLPKVGEMIYLDPVAVTWNSPPHIRAKLYSEDGERIHTTTNNQKQATCNPLQDPELTITAVYPSPEEDEDEWIEIQNLGDSSADLCGLFLDDIVDGGSKPWDIEKSTLIASGKTRRFTGADTGIRLNNTGDSVTILGEDDRIISQVEYGSTKKGEMVVFTDLQPSNEEQPTNVSLSLSNTEQKSSSIIKALPVKYVNVREEKPPQIAAEQTVENQLIALHKADRTTKQPSNPATNPSNNASIAWVVVFAQSVGWIVMMGRKWV